MKALPYLIGGAVVVGIGAYLMKDAFAGGTDKAAADQAQMKANMEAQKLAKEQETAALLAQANAAADAAAKAALLKSANDAAYEADILAKIAKGTVGYIKEATGGVNDPKDPVNTTVDNFTIPKGTRLLRLENANATAPGWTYVNVEWPSAKDDTMTYVKSELVSATPV